MNDFQEPEMLSPETLADILDRVLPPNEQVVHDADLLTDEPLVQTAALLASQPLPGLSAEAVERIQAQIITRASIQPVYNAPRIRWTVVAAAAVFALLVAGVLFVLLTDDADQRDEIVLLPTNTATSEVVLASVTPIPSTATLMPQITSTENRGITTAPAAITPTEIAPTNTRIPATFTPQLQRTSEQLPSPTMTPASSASIIIEGPVASIDVESATVTIYGFRIQLEEDAPLLEVIRVDDYLRVEGEVQTTAINSGVRQITIIAELVEPSAINQTDQTVFINPDSNEAWRDNGACDNPPPPWATANGWRNRCERGGSSSGSDNRPDNPGRARGRGNNDDSDGDGDGDDD
jgi:hypothetical protein